MAFTIQHKRKAGAIAGNDLSLGEIGIDTTNTNLYFSTDGTDAIKLANFDDITVNSVADGDTLTTGFIFPNTGLSIYDTDASNTLTLASGSNLTADRTLTITTGDADRTLTLAGDFDTADVTDLTTLTGVVAGSTDFGTQAFNSWSSIGDNRNIYQALGDLDIAIDGVNTGLLAYQPVNAALTDIAGFTPTDGNFIVGNGSAWVVETGATARTSLGLGTGDSPTFTGLTLTGDLTVDGTTTTINSTTLTVDDKNIELGTVDTPTDTTADGGGITLKGATDKTFNWVDATDAWTSSENLDLDTGKVYKIATNEVLSATALGSSVETSSLTSVGTLTTGTIDCGTISA